MPMQPSRECGRRVDGRMTALIRYRSYVCAGGEGNNLRDQIAQAGCNVHGRPNASDGFHEKSPPRIRSI